MSKDSINDYEDQEYTVIEGKPVLVVKSGEWLERYIEVLFMLSDFKTKRNVKINRGTETRPDVQHEIDVVAESEDFEYPILIECKDVSKFDKNYVDAFLGKLTDIDHVKGVIVTSNLDDHNLKKYRNYCVRKGIAFFDGEEIDRFIHILKRKKTIQDRKNYIYVRLGLDAEIQEEEPEEKEKQKSWYLTAGIVSMIFAAMLFFGRSGLSILLFIVGAIFFYLNSKQMKEE